MAAAILTSDPASLEDHLVAAGRGDDQAFAALYDASAGRVHGLVLRVVRDPHQAEEVTQEVFLQVWQVAHRFEPSRGSALSWLMMLAHRRAVDRVRSSEADRRRDETAVGRDVDRPFDETAHAVHATLEAGMVHDAFAVLSPAQRQAIELAWFGGHTYREVATIVGAPLGTVKTRIRDGLLRLREVLQAARAEPA